jgi:hypothetical protein
MEAAELSTLQIAAERNYRDPAERDRFLEYGAGAILWLPST